MFSNFFSRKEPSADNIERLNKELERANAACEASLQGTLGMEELLGVIALQCSLYIPLPEPLSGDPPNPEDWKTVMVEKNGIMWQYAFANLETAREFRKEHPYCVHGRVLRAAWIFTNLPIDVGLAICYRRNAVVPASPAMMEVCRRALKHAGASGASS